MLRSLLLMVLVLSAAAQERLPMRADMWREFDAYRGQLLQLARAIPAEKYAWRPGKGVRSVQEVLLHVGLTNYLLLDVMGKEIPQKLYPALPSSGATRTPAIGKKNLDLEAAVQGKQSVIDTVERAFAAVDAPMKGTSAAELNRLVMFVDRESSVGGIELRIIAHLHEHLGQLIAYAREVGVTPPWTR
jgi:uncharacterized damage-inducible protein DinB